MSQLQEMNPLRNFTLKVKPKKLKLFTYLPNLPTCIVLITYLVPPTYLPTYIVLFTYLVPLTYLPTYLLNYTYLPIYLIIPTYLVPSTYPPIDFNSF
jgi:hypothetical protein